ncbi:hypothetical protein K440DRAFT_170338 [Wilcoxina mikolae CBS 423.85]|nr:hypothetical protein K440DRAFT_170338 [Wilcoxina mikolae CBS 423.85]
MALSRQRAYSTTSTPPRTFTLPVRPPILDLKDPGSDFLNSGVGGAEHIQVLFAHSNSRIVNFTFSATTTLAGQPLPWKSPLERTIASGPLRIYKTVPHDVAFLQSGSALRPLLSRTQCWNVDGKATFCLQLRPGNYWRIEILGVEPEQDVKCAEFRDAMGKIVAFEVTACPFIRTEDCSPVTETPDALQPAKVWRRPTARRMDDATNDVSPEQSGGIFRDFRPTDVERPSTGEKPRLRLDPAISFKDIPSFDIARSWTNGAREESPTVMQRRSRYESLFTGGTFKPLRDENIPDRRRSSLAGEFVFARQQWRSEHSGDSKKLEELCVFDDEKHDGLGVAVGRPKSARALLFEACGLPEDDELEQTEACKTPPSEMYGSNVSPLAIKSTQMITNDDEYPSPESQLWRDFSPPHSPLSPKQKAFGVVAPFVAPPVLNDASVLGTPSRQSSCPATPERPPALTQWHTPAQQPAHPESRQRSQDRSQAIPTPTMYIYPELHCVHVLLQQH